MRRAMLEGNKVYCPKCEKCNYQLTDDYKLVSINNQKYTEFVARCLEKDCNEKFYFQSKITINEHTHYNFDREHEAIIKDED